jgi:endonuclease YncB( thermonuclease family)
MAAPPITYVRRVNEVRKVHDGDTYRFLIDQGVGDARDLWVRLKGIDTWELSQPGGPQARDVVNSLFTQAGELVIQTFKTSGGEDVMTFIRYVADVYVDGVLLQDIIRTQYPEIIKT